MESSSSKMQPSMSIETATSSFDDERNKVSLEKAGGEELHKIFRESKTKPELDHALERLLMAATQRSTSSLMLMTKKIDETWCRYKDDEGRVALHVLADNYDIVAGASKRSGALSHTPGSSGRSTPRRQSKFSLKRYRSNSSSMTLSSGGANSKPVQSLDGVVYDLISVYPEGASTEDGDGYVPFAKTITAWIEGTYLHNEQELEQQQNQLLNGASILSPKGFVGRFSKQGTASIQAVTNSIIVAKSIRSFASRNSGFMSPTAATTPHGGSMRGKAAFASMQNIPSISNLKSGHQQQSFSNLPQTAEVKDVTFRGLQGISALQANKWERTFPTISSVPISVEWSLHALSYILDNIETAYMSKADQNLTCVSPSSRSLSSMNTTDEIHADAVSDIIEAIVNNVASIPFFVKMLLLNKDPEQRERIFGLTVVKKAMLSRRSLGQWIVSMLSNEELSIRQSAVDYLQSMSVFPSEYMNDFGEVIASPEVEEFRAQQKDLFKAASMLEGLIPSMLMLDEQMIERAATTQIVKLVLDKMVSGKFTLSVVFFDGLFLGLLILSFRAGVNEFLSGAPDSSNVMQCIYCIHTCLFYHSLRELGKIVSLRIISWGVLRRHLWRIWFVVDVLSLPMALTCTAMMRLYLSSEDDYLGDLDERLRFSTFASLTTFLLWIRVLSLLKTINMHLATFVLATIQIAQDILWFLLFIIVVVIAAGQIFFTMLYDPDNCRPDADEYDAYSCDQAEYYLWTYKILLGDIEAFDRELLTSNVSIFLFVLFTFLVIVVLLNVLIAIVSDSHEKCLVRSDLLFGRARIILLAELVSFQYLLRKSKNEDNNCWEEMIPERFRSRWVIKLSRQWSWGSIVFFVSALSLFFLWTLAEIISFGRNHDSDYMNGGWLILSIIMNANILVVIPCLLSEDVKSASASGTDFENRFRRECMNWYEAAIQFLMLRVLGTTDENHAAANANGGGSESSWSGRAHYLKNSMQKTVRRSEARTTAEMKKLLEEYTSDAKVSANVEMELAVQRVANNNQLLVQKEMTQLKEHLRDASVENMDGTRCFAEKLVSQSEKTMKTEVDEISRRMKLIDSNTKADLKSLGRRMVESEDRIMKEMKASEERIKRTLEENMRNMMTSLSSLIESNK